MVLLSAASVLVSGMTSVPGGVCFSSSEWGSLGCPSVAHSLPMVGVAAFAILYTRGKALAGDSMVEATSLPHVLEVICNFTGVNCMYEAQTVAGKPLESVQLFLLR